MTERRYAVLGDPIEHSLSPSIHKAAYQVLGLDWDYQKRVVRQGGLKKFVDGEGSNFEGFSVTMPLKFEAAELASSVDSLVSLTGVANTLVKSKEGYLAFNTDVFGVSRSIEHVFNNRIEVVSILGAGATSRSVMVAIARAKPNVLFDIYVRDTRKAEGLVELAGELNVFTNLHTLDEFSNFQDLTVNTLPNDVSSTLPVSSQSGFLLNVNYSGSDENLVSSFDSSRVTSGQNMLIWQAVAQLRLFTTLNAELELPDEAKVFAAMSAAL
jgi:shikimate dehydrogenase